MSSIVRQLAECGAVDLPLFLPRNIMYEAIVGSHAYGVDRPDSDLDVYGFTIPPKHYIFPHLSGVIPGFGWQGDKFEQFQQNHVKSPDNDHTEYDITIYSIVRYFHLCAQGNPNIIDSLFTPEHLIVYNTKIGKMVREQRRLFLSKMCYYPFKGYAYSQIKNLSSPSPKYIHKPAYHAIRLLNELEQILIEGDLDLLRNQHQLKEIREGNWTIERCLDYFRDKEAVLDKLYKSSTLCQKPDMSFLKAWLLKCLEEHYGSLPC